MHELSLATGIVETVVKHAEGRRVTSVQMRIGTLRQVVPESLDFYFGICSRDTICEGAELEQEILKARASLQRLRRGVGARLPRLPLPLVLER